MCLKYGACLRCSQLKHIAFLLFQGPPFVAFNEVDFALFFSFFLDPGFEGIQYFSLGVSSSWRMEYHFFLVFLPRIFWVSIICCVLHSWSSGHLLWPVLFNWPLLLFFSDVVRSNSIYPSVNPSYHCLAFFLPKLDVVLLGHFFMMSSSFCFSLASFPGVGHRPSTAGMLCWLRC